MEFRRNLPSAQLDLSDWSVASSLPVAPKRRTAPADFQQNCSRNLQIALARDLKIAATPKVEQRQH
jgi:hypothetical protein